MMEISYAVGGGLVNLVNTWLKKYMKLLFILSC